MAQKPFRMHILRKSLTCVNGYFTHFKHNFVYYITLLMLLLKSEFVASIFQLTSFGCHFLLHGGSEEIKFQVTLAKNYHGQRGYHSKFK